MKKITLAALCLLVFCACFDDMKMETWPVVEPQEEVEQQDFDIEGPKLGITGSQYAVPKHETATVQWSTDVPETATISNDGRLTVKGKGVVTIKARIDDLAASRKIIVGTPQLAIDKPDPQPGFTHIKAKCIDTEPGYAEFIKENKGIITYEWGVGINDEPLQWIKTDSAEVLVEILEETEKATVYLKTTDMYGNESDTMNISFAGYDVWKTSYDTIIINKKGEVFEKRGYKMELEYATMSVTYKQSSYDGYPSARWNPFGAIIVTDDKPREVSWYRGTRMTNIITEEDIQRIITYPDNSVIVFKLILLNYDDRVIQKTPLTILYKADFTE